MLCYTATRDCLPIPPKKNSPCIPPAPSCTAETKSGKKGISRGFANHFSRKIASQNRVRISFRHLPEYLEGRTPKEKHPFLFQKKFHHHHIKKARNIFLWCCRVKRGGGGTIHSTSGFCWKKVRILFRRHSQVSEFVFSPKFGASQSDATGVSARIRQGFLKSKRSERDARRGFMMSTSFKTSFCEPIWKRIIINI